MLGGIISGKPEVFAKPNQDPIRKFRRFSQIQSSL
jgi:hypothetical protein